jgi:flagellar motor protein MotB
MTEAEHVDWGSITKKSEWKKHLQHLVKTDTKACLRAIVCIDQLQTVEEHRRCESVDENNVGWTKWDAPDMSRMAAKFRAGVQLSEGELARAKNKMPKYWQQLMMISKRRLAEKQKRQQQVEEEAKAQAEAIREAQLAEIQQCQESGIPCEYGICDECKKLQEALSR